MPELDNELSNRECVPCLKSLPPFSKDQIDAHLSQLEGWDLVSGFRLEKIFKFRDFREALDFTNRVGLLAERQQHHPNIYLTWGKVMVSLYTHKIGGLHLNDFILAAKIDRINSDQGDS